MKINGLISAIFLPKDKGRVIILTGCAGVGKSTISLLLCKQLKKCIYLSVDVLRENVVSGYEFPAKMEWSKETFLQSNLARKSALYMAKIYSDAGFDVVVDDTIYGENIKPWLSSFSRYPLFIFFLQANLHTIMRRNETRKTGRLRDEVIKYLFEKFEDQKNKRSLDPKVILTNNQGPRSITVNKILNLLQYKKSRN